MARIPGRSAWLAWPVGLVCLAVVAALVWFAQPMVPVAAAWVGDMLRARASQPFAAPTTAERTADLLAAAESDEPMECRTFYPDDLWWELAWRPDGLLSQTLAPPATSDTALTEALTPVVRLTCVWRFRADASVSTTLARVAAGSASAARASLEASGFSCGVASGVLSCARTHGAVVEEHAFAGDLWLSSVESGALPDDYGTRLAAALWG